MDTRVTFGFTLIVVWFVSTLADKDKFKIRLTLNSTLNEGRVEVSETESGEYRTICDEGLFEAAEATVICHELGYSHGRSTPNIYSVKDAHSQNGDFTLHCGTGSSGFSECQVTNWNNSKCGFLTSFYAGVCCSDSADFGEYKDGLFISHCKASLQDALDTCVSHDSHLATSRDIEGVFHEETDVTSTWIGQFYSPWIWSDGCVELNNKVSTYVSMAVKNNSPQRCSQFCGYQPNTVFALKGDICLCIKSTTDITLVKPRGCDRFCHPMGNYQMCGSNSIHWSLYTIADTGSIFVSLKSPNINQTSQCAQLLNERGERKLAEKDCNQPQGYLCRQVLLDGSDGNLLIKEKVTFKEARKRCHQYQLRLVGHDILNENSTIISGFSGSFVNIERVLTTLYEFDDMDRKISPTWCMYQSWSGTETRRHIVECDQGRRTFVCSKDKDADHAVVVLTTSNPVMTKNVSGEIITYTLRPVTKPPRTHTKSQDSLILEIALIGICSAIVVVIVVIVVICCWRRYSRRREKNLRRQTSKPNTSSHYLSIERPQRPADENVYSEINESEINTNSTLLKPRPLPRAPGPEYLELVGGKEYLELQNLGAAPTVPEKSSNRGNDSTVSNIEGNDDNGEHQNGGKQPLTIKASYSFPNDEIKPGQGQDEEECLDPRQSISEEGYVIPYDHVGPKKTCAESKSDVQTAV